MKNYLILIVGFLISFDVYAAAEVNNFKVVNVRVDKNGWGYVSFDKQLAGTPASCINGHDYHLAFDVNTEGGKGILKIVTAAKESNRVVWARGTGACDIYGSVESWNWGMYR